MLDLLERILSDECGLTRENTLLVGVSGGPDSLCLLDVLHRLGYTVHVAHVNHDLRHDADNEQRLVEQIARQRGLPVSSTKMDVLAYAEQTGIAIEEAARTLRYRFLFELAHQIEAQAVLVGHNLDDQTETVLMHILRGSGLNGLRGMLIRALPNAWSSSVPLVRPLLHIRRREIEAYCMENSLQPIQDSSNLDPSFTRNRIRLELIPQLESIQPTLSDQLLRLARLVGDDEDALQRAMNEAWSSCLLEQGERYVSLDLKVLNPQPVAIQRRLFRQAAEILLSNLVDVTFDDIERAVMFVKRPPQTKRSDWTAGLFLLIEESSLYIAGWEVELPMNSWPQWLTDQPGQLSKHGEFALQDEWVLRSYLVEYDAVVHQTAASNQDPYQAWLDAEQLIDPLFIRTREPGDKFEPLGMQGQRVSLKDWMIKHKLPRRARAGWPLICSGMKIAWVPGFQPAHWARITTGTHKLLHFSLVRK